MFSARNLFTRRSGGGLVQCEIGRFSNNIISVSRNRRFRTRYFITVRTIILDRYCCLHFLELFRFVFDCTADKSLRRSSNTYGCATTINCRRRYAARSLFFFKRQRTFAFDVRIKKKNLPIVPAIIVGNQLFYYPREVFFPATICSLRNSHDCPIGEQPIFNFTITVPN